MYRIRWNDYRILYEIMVKDRLVMVGKIDHRSGAYGP